jgi:hypothetical protein
MPSILFKISTVLDNKQDPAMRDNIFLAPLHAIHAHHATTPESKISRRHPRLKMIVKKWHSRCSNVDES